MQYFETRRKFESRQFAGLDADRIARYREEKRQFASTANELLYQQWLTTGSSAFTSDSDSRSASFRTVVLTYDYNLFGGLRRAS